MLTIGPAKGETERRSVDLLEANIADNDKKQKNKKRVLSCVIACYRARVIVCYRVLSRCDNTR